MVEVVVPYRGECPHRRRAWRWVRERYAGTHPDWRLTVAAPPAGPWRKGAAVNPAIRRSRAAVIVVADADVWTEGLTVAVEAVMEGAPWARPHAFVHRLSEKGTAAVLNGADWRGQTLAEKRPYRGIDGGGIVVATRQALLTAPIDPRFVSWGQEDECQAMALRTLCGAPWRGSADLYHLWHPPQARSTRRRGSPASMALRLRYHNAHAEEDPAAMAALIEEGRDGAD